MKPGFEDSFTARIRRAATISGHPVRLSMQLVHFPFSESRRIRPACADRLAPYSGDWHAGADIYKRWLPPGIIRYPCRHGPRDIHAWQQLQINSSEDDLRTRYVDLPQRVADDAKHGITVLQLVGWNHGGQDRDNPFDDIDPRLGTAAELKDAIRQIEKIWRACSSFCQICLGRYFDRLVQERALQAYGDRSLRGHLYAWAGLSISNSGATWQG